MRLHLNGFDDDGSDRLLSLTAVVAVLVLTAAAMIYMGVLYQAPAMTMTHIPPPSPL
jgi:hypothetical protein